MHLQLTGRLNPGETYGEVNILPSVLPPGPVLLKLINLVVCYNRAHALTHFPGPVMSPYPAVPPYEENIIVVRPAPQLVIHRRRTINWEENVAEEEEEEDHRFKRSTTQPKKKRVKRANKELGEFQFYYKTGFKNASLKLQVKKLNTSVTLRSLAETIINSQFRTQLSIHFQHLVDLTNFKFELEPENGVGPKSILVITLPPKSRFFFEEKGHEILTLLGMSDTDIIKIPTNTGGIFFYGFSNRTAQPVTFTGSKAVRPTSFLFSAAAGGNFPDSVHIRFEILDRAVESVITFEEAVIPRKKIAGTLLFFKNVLNWIQTTVDLIPSSLEASINDAGEINLSKTTVDHNENQTTGNFQMNFQFGGSLANLLLLKTHVLAWEPRKKLKFLLPLGAEEADGDSEDETEFKLANLSSHFYNQESNHLQLKAAKKEWDETKLQIWENEKQIHDEADREERIKQFEARQKKAEEHEKNVLPLKLRSLSNDD